MQKKIQSASATPRLETAHWLHIVQYTIVLEFHNLLHHVYQKITIIMNGQLYDGRVKSLLNLLPVIEAKQFAPLVGSIYVHC